VLVPEKNGLHEKSLLSLGKTLASTGSPGGSRKSLDTYPPLALSSTLDNGCRPALARTLTRR
jgi:hypothetical protein